jgi:hypothetical protein
MIRPWLSPPLETYETTDIWIDSSCNGYGTFQYGTIIPAGDSTPVGSGNGDNPCANNENRVYARIRNIGTQTAASVKVNFEVTNPLGLGIVGSGSGNWTPIGSVTSTDFPGLASIPPGGTVDVWVPWIPKVLPDQLTTGNFNFHSCVRVKIDPVSGELNTQNQDGDGEQENIGQFYSPPSSGAPGAPGPAIDQMITIRNESSTRPTLYHLSWASDLPAGSTLVVNNNVSELNLAAGELRQIPVHIIPAGNKVSGQIYQVKVRAESLEVLVNPTNPVDTHGGYEQLSAVTFQVRIAIPSNILVAARPGGAGLVVIGQLTPATHPGLPIYIELLDSAGNVLASKLIRTDAAGNYSTDLVRPRGVAFAAASFVGEAFQQGAYARVAVPILAPPVIAKFFTPVAIPLGGISTVTFSITNPNATSPLSGVGFSDLLPAGLMVAPLNGLTGSCGGGSITATPGANTIGLTGATLGPGASCTFSLNVASTTAGLKFNTTGSIGSVEGGLGNTASAALAVAVTPGPAACGADGFPDPLSLFQRWTYSMEGFAIGSQPLASSGQFQASISTGKPGTLTRVLNITNSSSQNGQITSQETDGGTYQINSNCSGGTLTFNLSTRPIQFDFWFAGFGRIAFISTTVGFTVHGTASASAITCPSNPLDALTGTWTYSTEGLTGAAVPFSSSGLFLASTGAGRSGNVTGLLNITNTSSQNGLITSQEVDGGSFQVNANCSGGTLTFNLSTRPLQFDFWFIDDHEIRFVSTSAGFTIRGTATR